MPINIKNFIKSQALKYKMNDFQDLDHIDGVSISTICANLYNKPRDDLVMFYFRDGANYASVYTQSKIVSENIKWNLNIKSKKIRSLIINTRNANAFTGPDGYKSLEDIAEQASVLLSKKQLEDEDNPKKILSKEIIFGCTGTIGEKYPLEKIKNSIPELIEKIRYTQNKYVWIKAALGIMTTDLKPKLAMEKCEIGNKEIKIYGIAKGSGMIFPNMATTLGYIFTDADLSNDILNRLLKKNIETTFNAISCDGDTSTNDMVTIFSTAKVKNPIINNINDKKIKAFDEALHSVLLNLSKRIVADGEGASKFITINVTQSKTENDAKKIAFSIANSPLVKTAIFGNDPNWGRIIMAIGKTDVEIDISKLSIKLGSIKVIEKGQLSKTYIESDAEVYMKEEKKIDIVVNLNLGKKNFTAYTMDLTKKYIEINADYRS
ncbi:glutamate N-acetyltransferase [Candidatus Pelagibacter ubique]|uniref:Arginine biosynthesis bifunctional protein ArgJ n=1 Tax=Pelagibacter ubique TaxID=198252 RepID=A0ABX1T2L2_PELUQ|nr:bifunctional glutamate N-acetyltransferase/amino-acid acetyltransferase ArgJ [Candidatus Pelagibacter ubique]NMN67116.1 glutamate N-acetyltransferase [Candidatus Pelagibacter ubique]